MSDKSSNADDNQSDPSSDLVTNMLDRPVADVVRFSGRLFQTWFRGLIDPWRLGKHILYRPNTLAQPFAFLVVMLFSVGVAMRLVRAIRDVSFLEDGTIKNDLHLALGDVSLMNAVLATLPCILVVHLGAWLFGKLMQLISGRKQFQLHTAVCYAVGWQSGAITALMALVVVLQLYGYEPTGQMTDEFNDLIPYVAVLVFLWGSLILLPTIFSYFDKKVWWKSLSLSGMAMLVSTLFLFGGMATLKMNTDLSTVTRVRMERQLDRWTGDLQINRIATRPLEKPNSFEVTLVFNNRTDRVLVVPFPSDIISDEKARISRGKHVVKVISSSWDSLPGRTIVLEPKQTVAASFEMQLTQMEPPKHPNENDLGFKLTYHLRNPLESVLAKKEAYFFLPSQDALVKLAKESNKKATFR